MRHIDFLHRCLWSTQHSNLCQGLNPGPGESLSSGCALVNPRQASFFPPEMKNVKGKKNIRLLVDLFKSKRQGWVQGGRSPTLPRKCAVRRGFRWELEFASCGMQFRTQKLLASLAGTSSTRQAHLKGPMSGTLPPEQRASFHLLGSRLGRALISRHT